MSYVVGMCREYCRTIPDEVVNVRLLVKADPPRVKPGATVVPHPELAAAFVRPSRDSAATKTDTGGTECILEQGKILELPLLTAKHVVI